MAAKRQKKSAATEVSKPAEVEVPPSGPAAARSEARAAPSELRAKSGTVETTRGDFTASSDSASAKRSAVGAAPADPAATAGETNETLDREQQIRERAYHLWKRDGEPHGLDEHHWTLAEQFLQGKL
jgi:hypothetical protein